MFIAHKNDIKEKCYKLLAQLDNRFIINDIGSLVSNICPHQNSLISSKAGTGIRVCPYHNWSFDLKGNPVGSGRTAHYCKNSNALESKPTFECNSLLFDLPVDFKLPIDFGSMMLVEQRVDKVRAGPNIVMDLFLDVDHIETVHSNVYDQIGLSNITSVDWKYYDWGSIQIVPDGDKIGAAWIAVYPGTMIEWQKGALFITVAKATSAGSDIHVFKYKDTNYSNEAWILNERVWETAWKQDRAQAELIVQLPQSNLEESKQHFRKWNLSKTTI